MKRISFSNIFVQVLSAVIPLRKDNVALRILCIFNGIFVFASGLLGPLYALFVTENISSDITVVSTAWAAFLLSTTVFITCMKLYGNRVKEREYLLLGGYAIRAIVWFIFPFTSGVVMLICLQIALGLGEAIGTPSFDALLSEHVDANRRIEEYADWRVITNVSNALSVLLGGYIITMFGFTPLFFCMGILALVAFVGVLVQPRSLL